MGRSTRFFGARVLRSGRRVSTGPTPDNLVDLKDKDNEVVRCNKQGNAVGCRVWKVDKVVDGDTKSRMDVDEGEPELERPDLLNIEEKKVEEIVDKMYGIVYRRKGKRKRGKENEGRQYFRRKKRRGVCSNEYGHRSSVVPNVSKGQRESLLNISIVVGSCGIRSASISSYSIISSLLHSVLRYLRKVDVRLWSLRAFVCMEPIVHVFAARGIRFLQNFNSVGEVGSCIITGVRSSVPVLSVDFAALPFVFLHLHSSLSLWSARLFYFSGTDSNRPESENELSFINDVSSCTHLKRNETVCEFMVDTNSGTEEELNSVNEFSSIRPLNRNQTGCKFVVDIGAIVMALPAPGADKVGDQSVHIKSGCKIQKRRSSHRKPSRASCHSIFRSRHDGIQLSSQVSTHQLRSSNRRKVLSDVNKLKSTSVEITRMPVPSFIPVPRVSEVDGYGEISDLPFERPSCYISVKNDELTRALKKQTANYDMDSDDEDWLHKFNSAYNEEREVDEDLSAERFELMMDAFEKAYHCNPDVSSHAEAAYSIFPNLETKVVEAVYNNWIMKRKLKRAPLVRVFQVNPVYQRKSQFISTFSSRKKRSSKRHGIQASRGKQTSFFHAFVAEQDAIEKQNILKLEEAKATLERLEKLASQKRQRAQELFEISEVATYKALMAVRIAEAAQLTGSTDVAASYIIGQTF